MRTGTAISAAGHASLIALALFGMPWLSKPDAPPIRVTNVSFVPEADFEAARATAEDVERIPDAPPARPAPPRPEVLPEPAPPPAAERPEPAPEPAPAAAQVATVAPPFNPEAPLTPAPEGVTLAPLSPAPLAAVTPPRPRPVERVVAEAEAEPPAAEPAPVVEPEPDPAPAPQVEPAPVVEAPPAPAGQVAAAAPPRPRPAALDRPALPRRVAAAEPEPQRSEPQRPVRPAAERPATPRPQATPATPATPPGTTPATPASPAGGAPATSLPVGPPMTGAEKDGLKLAVQRCWNVPAGLRDAQQLKVTIGAELTAQGEIISSSIRLLEPSSPPDGRFRQAFEAGRRALLRCGPYALPREKYAQWRNIEVVFNPEGMVSW